jgi:hypothetical protein
VRRICLWQTKGKICSISVSLPVTLAVYPIRPSQKGRGLPSNDVSQIVVGVGVSVSLGLAVHGQGVVIVARVANEAGPEVPTGGDVAHAAHLGVAVLIEVLASVKGNIPLENVVEGVTE